MHACGRRGLNHVEGEVHLRSFVCDLSQKRRSFSLTMLFLNIPAATVCSQAHFPIGRVCSLGDINLHLASSHLSCHLVLPWG